MAEEEDLVPEAELSRLMEGGLGRIKVAEDLERRLVES